MNETIMTNEFNGERSCDVVDKPGTEGGKAFALAWISKHRRLTPEERKRRIDEQDALLAQAAIDLAEQKRLLLKEETELKFNELKVGLFKG
jgi:hypothetical protein